MAKALVKEPKIWLMDEPLSNLDAILRVQVRAELKKLQMSLGITTIYVKHDQVEALTLADKVAVMEKYLKTQATYVLSPSSARHQ